MSKILRVRDVEKMLGLHRTTIWRLEAAGNFPKRFKIGLRAVGWHEHEILDWLNSRPRFVVKGSQET